MNSEQENLEILDCTEDGDYYNNVTTWNCGGTSLLTYNVSGLEVSVEVSYSDDGEIYPSSDNGSFEIIDEEKGMEVESENIKKMILNALSEMEKEAMNGIGEDCDCDLPSREIPYVPYYK